MARGIPFPAGLSPNRRAYSPGAFPISEFQYQTAPLRRCNLNRVADSELALTFTISLTTKRLKFLSIIRKSTGAEGMTAKGIGQLSREVAIGPLAGVANESLRSVMAESRGNRRYRYAEPPTITSVFPESRRFHQIPWLYRRCRRALRI